MDNITSIVPKEEQKKEFFVKRAWKKISGFCKKYSEKIIDVLVTTLIFVVGICYGWILGILNKENNREHYDAGKRDGWNRGYADAVKDVESNGYTVYGGYGENASKMILTKTEEVNVKTEE